MLYDDRYHMHLGYYEKGFDLETVYNGPKK
ncbi:DUF3986 family protein, partial [Cytobacillus firmus]